MHAFLSLLSFLFSLANHVLTMTELNKITLSIRLHLINIIWVIVDACAYSRESHRIFLLSFFLSQFLAALLWVSFRNSTITLWETIITSSCHLRTVSLISTRWNGIWKQPCSLFVLWSWSRTLSKVIRQKKSQRVHWRKVLSSLMFIWR